MVATIGAREAGNLERLISATVAVPRPPSLSVSQRIYRAIRMRAVGLLLMVTIPSTLTDIDTSGHRGFVLTSSCGTPAAGSCTLTRDINIQVAVAVEGDTTTVEVGVSGGDEGMRADVTELVLAHLGELWAQLEVANRIRAVEPRDTRHRGSDA